MYGDMDGPWPWMRHDKTLNKNCDAMLMSGNVEFRPVSSRCWNM